MAATQWPWAYPLFRFYRNFADPDRRPEDELWDQAEENNKPTAEAGYRVGHFLAP
jgi:hypothetical protein